MLRCNEMYVCINIDGWMDGSMDGWMDRWMDGSMDGWIVYAKHVPYSTQRYWNSRHKTMP